MPNLDKLLMFTEKGYEVPLTKIYTVEWKLIPHPIVEHLFISDIKGHIMYGIDENGTLDLSNPKIMVDEHGKVRFDETVTIQFNDPDKTTYTVGGSFESVKDLLLMDLTPPSESYEKTRYRKVVNGVIEEYTHTERERICNNIRITFNTLEQSYIMDYPVSVVFDNFSIINKTQNVVTNTSENPNDSNIDYDEWVSNNTEDVYAYVGTYEAEYQGITLAPAPVVPDHTYNDILDALIQTNFSGEAKKSLYPGIRYQGCIWQDRVSTEFVAANTIIMLEDTGDAHPKRPKLNSPGWNFMFKFQNDSEMRFISSNTIADIIWDKEYVAEENTEDPLNFAVGFIAELEGCYQNIMAMYIRHEYTEEVFIDGESGETEERLVYDDYLLGLITFFTEVEGEDERYRALLGNMGIPDPEKYSRVFRESDPDEEGVDWILVNNKSKELMINYDNIFPYVGTYKALLGAVRFLGYYDLIFKEWYKIKDKTGRDKFITLQAYDLQKGESLQTKLKRINVDFGEFEKYKKLNRLTMIYHLNEMEDVDGENLTYYIDGSTAIRARKSVTDDEGNTKTIFTWIKSPQDASQYFQTPNTIPIYQYRTNEVLAKLYSVKEWLEKYILGVNCYISDICGEGLVIERLKTQAYVTEHYIQDFTSEGKFTPKFVDTSRAFLDSSTMLTCTLNEFTNLTIEDYEDWNIEKFINDELVIDGHTIYISPPFETPVAATEYQFRLQLDKVESGTLAEFTDKNYITNPILVRDNKIIFYNNIDQESKIQSDELPLIEVKKANIRYCHGNWKNNVCYTVNTVIDQYTGKEYYVFKSRNNEVDDYRGLQKIYLAPIPTTTTQSNIFGAALNLDDDTNGNYFGLNSNLIYSARNKWNIPMFIMHNYIIRNTNQVLEGDYILEILEGRMIFRNKSPEINVGKAQGAEIRFGYYYDIEQGEQEIDMYYTYLSDRVPIYYFDKTGFINDPAEDKFLDTSVMDQYMTVNKFVDVNVNRLGEYTIQVNAFDHYNNIFVNNSDDTIKVQSNPIPVDIILNQDFVWNDKDFYEKSGYGIPMETEEKQQLFNDIYMKSGYAMYPQNWRIYDIDPVLDTDNQIKYDSISYAIELPKTGDFIMFNNFTERATKVSAALSHPVQFTISLCDENPNADTLINSSYVGLCIYDNLSKEILADAYPIEVRDTSIYKAPNMDDPEYMDYTYNKSKISVYAPLDTEPNRILADLKNKRTLESNKNIQGYVYPANELILDTSDISVNYKDNLTYVKDFSQHFIENQVVKICYSTEEEIHNRYTNNAIDNEYILRVTDVSTVDGSIVYTLDGIIDLYKLNNKIYHNKAEHYVELDNISPLLTSNPYIIKMCPAHLRAAQYTLRVSEIGQESVAYYNGAETNEITVNYEHLPLLFNHYLDTTYSATVCQYDPYMLKHIYTDVSVIFNSDDNLYVYRDFPVTIKKDRIAILRPYPEQETLTTEFYNSNGNDVSVPLRIDWDWQSYIIDELDNSPNLYLNLVNKQTIFKSCNPILPIRPELLGTQSPNMTVTDVYGNALINHADGFMFIDINEDAIYNRAEQYTREIYYRDVYIVGFNSTISIMHTMMADGETATFTNNETGAGEDTYAVNIDYTIYYNDGTVVHNEGATVDLLSKTGKKARGNKVKVTVPEATEPHKFISTQIQAMITFDNTSDRDLIQSEIIEDIDIYQYGYSKTTRIYDFTFTVNDLPAEGIEELQEYIIRDYITNISYTADRSEGEVEHIQADTLNEANLVISQYKLMDKKQGFISSVEPNYDGRKLLGILQLTVDFYVNGVTDIIRAVGIADVYQQ